MNRKMLSVLATFVMMAVFACSPIFSQAPQTHSGQSVNTTAGEPHPLIHRAIAALETAKAELQDAAHDYCGHKADAIGSIDAALSELHAAIACDNAKMDSTGDLSFARSEAVEVSTGAGAPHPRISAAIAALQSARNNLNNAAQVYCGHRAAALGATDHAIEQLHAAIACAKW
jgi:multidrug resistance efflux pump